MRTPKVKLDYDELKGVLALCKINFSKCQTVIDMLVAATPTGDLRNELTEVNINALLTIKCLDRIVNDLERCAKSSSETLDNSH